MEVLKQRGTGKVCAGYYTTGFTEKDTVFTGNATECTGGQNEGGVWARGEKKSKLEVEEKRTHIINGQPFTREDRFADGFVMQRGGKG